ncbi:bifunctional DNA primase/polymerase [Magnetospirillum aberrantis]|uniref:DNA primase/polymerase bifunctional N-terminal domain-containing protein n=1 Tax=Magnetospirillum aberrantis SpK TaxID=908842 RepID=A0A7C9QV14_9PROT|nr:bifunctional DNA primase/polymerase [Magnetospirillum aberrantis]NFV81298.1 hypothetical protein [Magnetospirillum aberrantis SpK]
MSDRKIADTPAHFMREYGPRLQANGWPVLPILPPDAHIRTAPWPSGKQIDEARFREVQAARGKAPGKWTDTGWWTYGGWQDIGLPAASLVAYWCEDWPPHSVGCAMGFQLSDGSTVVALDNDVRHAGAADAIDALLVRMLGRTPVRVGAPPKRTRFYRVRDALPKGEIATTGYAMPGDDPHQKAHRLEVLGKGRQSVLFGVHPGTGRPYSWPESDVLGIQPVGLPLIGSDQLMAAIDAADAILREHGGAEKSKSRLHGNPERDAPRRPRAEYLAKDPHELKAALVSIKNDDFPRADWVGMAHAIKGALGDTGEAREIWLDWSLSAPKSSGDPAASLRVWDGIRDAEIRSGAGTIYWLAKSTGWRPSRIGKPCTPDFALPVATLAEAAGTVRNVIAGFVGEVEDFLARRSAWIAAGMPADGRTDARDDFVAADVQLDDSEVWA